MSLFSQLDFNLDHECRKNNRMVMLGLDGCHNNSCTNETERSLGKKRFGLFSLERKIRTVSFDALIISCDIMQKKTTT